MSGVERGVMLSTDTLSFGDFVNARRAANRLCGWEDRATSAYREMREKDLSEAQIIENLLDIKIQMWRILEKWQAENVGRDI